MQVPSHLRQVPAATAPLNRVFQLLPVKTCDITDAANVTTMCKGVANVDGHCVCIFLCTNLGRAFEVATLNWATQTEWAHKS